MNEDPPERTEATFPERRIARTCSSTGDDIRPCQQNVMSMIIDDL